MPDGQPTWRDYVAQEARNAKLSPDLVFAMLEQESGGKQGAISPKGATGFFQLMPETAKELGVDATDPRQNILGGLKYLRQQIDRYNGDVGTALAAYNAGPGAVEKAGGKIPNFPETQAYVRSILGKLRTTQTTEPNMMPEAQGVASPTIDAPRPSMTLDPPPDPRRFERTGTQMGVRMVGDTKVLPIAGSMIGGILGAASGGPSVVGVPVLGVAGAGTGAGVGESAQMALEEAVGLPNEGGPPALRILSEGAMGATGEGLGNLAFRAGKRLLAPAVKKMTVTGYEALRSLGGKVLPAQVTKSRTLDILQNISEGSILGGGRIKEFKEQQGQLIDGLVDRTLQKYGGRTAPEEAGQAFIDALEGNIETFHKAGGRLFKEVDTLTSQAEVPTNGIRSWARQELERRGALGTAGTPDVPASSILDEFGKPARAAVPGTPGTRPPLPKELTGDSGLNLLKEMADLPETITFEQAQFIRSELLKKGRSIADPNKDVTKAIAEQLTRQTDSALEQTAQTLGGDAEAAFRAANAFWKQGKAQFETKFLRKLIEQEPDAVAARLVANNRPVTVRAARAAVPAATWKKVQGSAATKLVEGATDAETSAISGNRLLTQIKTMGASFSELFPTTADEVKRLGRTLATVQRGQAEGTGRMWIQLAQGSAVAGVLGGGVFTGNIGTGLGSAGVILLGPRAVARIMTSPRGIRWLTTGLTAPKGSETAARAAANLAAFLSESGVKSMMGEDEGPPPLPQHLIGYQPSGPPPTPTSAGRGGPPPVSSQPQP